MPTYQMRKLGFAQIVKEELNCYWANTFSDFIHTFIPQINYKEMSAKSDCQFKICKFLFHPGIKKMIN